MTFDSINFRAENLKKVVIYLISIFPICLFIGPLIAEICMLLINIIFLSDCKFKEIKKNKNIKIFLIIWIYLLLNIIISENDNFEYIRQIFYIRFIILAFAIYHFVTDEKDLTFIFKIWLITAIPIYIDLIYEKINGVNLLGYKSPNHLRLVGILKDELKIAHIISAFCIGLCGYLIQYKNKYYFGIFF